MVIKLWLTSANGVDMNIDVETLVEGFTWTSEYIPLVGDAVSVDLEETKEFSDIGWVDGKVTHREFVAGKDEVNLTLKIERNILRQLDQLLRDKVMNKYGRS